MWRDIPIVVRCFSGRPGTTRLSAAALATFACLPACSNTCHFDSIAQTFRVDVEHGTRRTSAGDRVSYSLFTPQPNETLAAPPYPAIVLSHGFARDKRFHRNTGCALAERGIVVLTPDLSSLLGGEDAQLRNIENLVDHVRWLRSRAADPNDPLFGLLDPDRLGLVGQSAGGAISFEAAVDLAHVGADVSAVVLLDTVPWSRTVDRAGALRDTAFVSLRSEPSACNANGNILDLLDGLSIAAQDLLVVGGSHCDPENPTDLLCELACGGSNNEARRVYQELLYAFLRDALPAPDLGDTMGFTAVLERLIAEGRVVRTSIEELFTLRNKK
jgi:pimeloyl-ACP methyl ester carboxylesterase